MQRLWYGPVYLLTEILIVEYGQHARVPSIHRLGSYDSRTVIFGLATVFCSVVTGWAVIDDQDLVTVSLLGVLTLYVLGNALPVIYQRVPRFKQVAAVPLGVVGGVAYATGAPTDIPIFFILVGVGSLIDLLWDPTGNVYADDSE